MFYVIGYSAFGKVEYWINIVGLLEDALGWHKFLFGEVEEDSDDGLIFEDSDHFFIKTYICIF
jgi:hypothetical protein